MLGLGFGWCGAVFCCLAGSGTTAWCKDWSCYILHRHSYHQLAPYTAHNKHTVEGFLINVLPQQRRVFRSEQCREKIWGHILMHTT